MRQMATVTMSMRELDRLKCIQAVIDGELRVGMAAERLGVRARQTERLVIRYRTEGPVGSDLPTPQSNRQPRAQERRRREDPGDPARPVPGFRPHAGVREAL